LSKSEFKCVRGCISGQVSMFFRDGYMCISLCCCLPARNWNRIQSLIM